MTPGAPLATVLVADDELHLLGVMARLLADRGYAVVTARDGSEALRAFEANRAAIAIAVVDAQIAPDGAGAVLAALLAASPGLGVVLTSGGLLAGSEVEGLRRRGAILLPKPFPASALLRAIADVTPQPEA